MPLFHLLQTPVSDAASTINSSGDYFPIGIQIIFAILFVVGMMGLTHWMGPKRLTTDKLQTFESGIEQQGNARQPIAIKYFLVAILFVLFDVEVIFFYPYAVNFRGLGWEGFLAVLMLDFSWRVSYISLKKAPCIGKIDERNGGAIQALLN
jgi:NADH-quinone oxidoreductase subunit A